jgi:urea transport system substrate-binding protein
MASSEAPVVDAVLLAIDEVNRAGGVLGRPIEALVADGRSDPQVFLREATRLIDEEKVPVVFGCWTSPSRKTITPLFEERDHLLVYPAQHEGLEESPNVFYTGAAPNQQILPALAWAAETLKAKRFFIVGTDSVFPHAAAAIVKDAAAGMGIEVVGEEYLPYGTRSAGAIASFVASEKPDVLLNFISGDANVTLFTALRRAEVRPDQTPTISFSIGEAGLRSLDPSDIAGDYAAWNYFQAIDSPENKAFLAAFRSRYGPQRSVTDPMEAAYVGLKLWASAANEAHTVEPRPVRAALRGQRLAAPEGPVRVDAASQHVFRTPRVGRIGGDGRFALVWSAPAPVPPEPYPHTRPAEQWKAFLRDLQRDWGGQWTAPAK